MQGYPQFTTPPPPPWNAADSFRETTLICIDDPVSREALRQVGRMIYEMAIVTAEFPGDESTSHAEMRAALAELRFIEGFFHSMRQAAEESCLDPQEARLARFAGKMAVQVRAIVAAVERELRPVAT
jgi:hypothetical protein